MADDNKPTSSDDDGEPEEVTEGALDRRPPANVMVIYPNPEKKGKIRLGQEEYMPNVTSRMLLSGPPGSGKRNVILNLVSRMIPPPSVCHLVHHDPDTIEYDKLAEWGIPVLIYKPNDMPNLENIDDPWGDKKGGQIEDEQSDQSDPSEGKEGVTQETSTTLDNPLIIIDEVTADSLNKIGLHRFERLINHACTHRNATLICSSQSAMNVPPKARRGFNHYALWKQADEGLSKVVAGKVSVKPEVLEDLLGLLKTPHDFIWIDLDSAYDSPWRFRLNLIEPINIQVGQ